MWILHTSDLVNADTPHGSDGERTDQWVTVVTILNVQNQPSTIYIRISYCVQPTSAFAYVLSKLFSFTYSETSHLRPPSYTTTFHL